MKSNMKHMIKKELREVFRDKKSLSMMLIIPIMIPLLILGMSALFDMQTQRDVSEYNKIGFAYEMTEEEKSELSTKCRQLKMRSTKDGKMYATDTLDTKGILRLIESVPSPKAEPFKLWLANLGSERIDEVFDPEIAMRRAINYYRNRGYDDAWIERRIKAIINRNKLTDVWKKGGITEEYEYAVLTNEIYKAWSGMTAREYKDFKGLRKESLRDNMTDLEVALTDLGELATRELVKEYKPYGMDANKKIANIGGSIADNTRKDLENKLGKSIVSGNNSLNYQYEKDNLIGSK